MSSTGASLALDFGVLERGLTAALGLSVGAAGGFAAPGVSSVPFMIDVLPRCAHCRSEAEPAAQPIRHAFHEILYREPHEPEDKQPGKRELQGVEVLVPLRAYRQPQHAHIPATAPVLKP